MSIQLLTPVLNIIIVAILGFLGKEIVKVIPKLTDFIVAKIGLTNYQKLQLFGKDAWNETEEFFRLNPIIGSTIQAKIIKFETLIKQKVPGITDAEITSVRQAIAGEYNKDKAAVIKAVENPVQEVQVNPVLKYVAPDGTELVPATTNATTPTVSQDIQSTATASTDTAATTNQQATA